MTLKSIMAALGLALMALTATGCAGISEAPRDSASEREPIRDGAY